MISFHFISFHFLFPFSFFFSNFNFKTVELANQYIRQKHGSYLSPAEKLYSLYIQNKSVEKIRNQDIIMDIPRSTLWSGLFGQWQTRVYQITVLR